MANLEEIACFYDEKINYNLTNKYRLTFRDIYDFASLPYK